MSISSRNSINATWRNGRTSEVGRVDPRAPSPTIPSTGAHRVTRPTAFTLLEVLIAVAVFSIVLAAMNSIFYGAIRLRNKAAQHFDDAMPLEHALATIKRDLANVVAPAGALSGTLQTTLTTNTIVPGQASPDFYTAIGMLDDNVPWGDVQKVSYVLGNSVNGTAGKNLFRAVTRNLLAVQTEAPTQEFLLGGVQNIFFSYYDGYSWQAAWDSVTQSNLPIAIKVQLQLATDKVGAALDNTPIELVIPLDSRTTNSIAVTTPDMSGDNSE